jgi:Protein of unknown function (DUF664)
MAAHSAAVQVRWPDRRAVGAAGGAAVGTVAAWADSAPGEGGAARASLDDEFTMGSWCRRVSVRWVYVHMIEEYARHNGHSDLLRERIDGVTGI